MERVFIVKREFNNNGMEFNNAVVTAHWGIERCDRHNKIMSVIGSGILIKSFVVDTEHPNGDEIHNVYSNGIVLIQNLKTRKLVTELIARPQQIKRYWEKLGMAVPTNLDGVLIKARYHQERKYNEW